MIYYLSSVLEVICPFHLSCQIYWHKVIYNILQDTCRICGVVVSLVPDVGPLCLFFLFWISQARGLSILFIFSKNKLCVLLIFSVVFWFSIHQFHSDFYYSHFLLTLDLIAFLFLVS